MNVGTEVEISIGHRLMDYEGLCAHPHGHNYRIVVERRDFPDGMITGRGMYLDFKDLRRILGGILDSFDHAMMLRHDDPLVPFLREKSNRLVVVDWNPTAENFAMYIRQQLSWSTGENFRVRVYETSKSYAEV